MTTPPPTQVIFNLSRRRFLAGSALAGGGLILGVHLPAFARSQSARQNAAFQPNAFIRIGADNSVTILVNHSEMGQGSYTSLPMLVAEELDADWSTVRAEHAPVAPAYNHSQYGIQMVGGSTSVRSEWQRMREAGAAARVMLLAAAARMWNVEPAACRTESGRVIHDDTNRSARYGELVERAASVSPPQNVTLKDPKDFRIIGKATKRLDTPAKLDGSAIFGIDVKLPGMLVAVVERPPVFGGSVKRFDAARAKQVPGVRHVVQIDRGVAVVADGYWPAHKGRQALEIEWDDGPLGSLDSDAQRAEYAELAKSPGATARHDGDADEALAHAAKTLEATFDLPYLAHATMEPINCVADVRDDSCEVWTGTQFQTVDHAAAAQETGLAPEKVKLHTTMLGGGFGRRAVPDSHFVREAVQISKTIGAPVKVIWSREDDTRGGYYRPAAHHVISAGLDSDGKPVAWRHRIVCQSFVVGTPFESAIIHDGVDETAVEGASDLPYDIPNVAVDWQQAPGGVPTLWWRSVGHSHNAFVVETFIDELARAARQDPIEFRRSLLKNHPRHRGVLDRVAEMSKWHLPLRGGHARGVAVHESFGSFVACVVEASVSREGHITVHRVFTAIDCGRVVNPDTIEAQIESGAVYGLTAALYGEITFEHGRVKQRNFHDYRMLRMHEMPRVRCAIIDSTEPLGGVGEPCVPPVAPALANAIYAASTRRVRRLPIDPRELRPV